MITVELTMDEAHATADTVRELLERNELSLDPIDREALRTADNKVTNAVDTAEFYRQAEKLSARRITRWVAPLPGNTTRHGHGMAWACEMVLRSRACRYGDEVRLETRRGAALLEVAGFGHELG